MSQAMVGPEHTVDDWLYPHEEVARLFFVFADEQADKGDSDLQS